MMQIAGFDKLPKGFVLLLGLGLLYALPLLLDGRYYLDDMPRAMDGLTHWQEDGRPLASILASLLTFNWPSFSGPALYDASPIPQIVGLAALAYGAARLAGRLFPGTIGIWEALVVFPITASPLMLQNLSYKYDAFTMGLAIALALGAATIEASWLVALPVLLSLTLYQAAFNVFVGAAVLVWLASSEAHRAFIRKLLWGFAALVIYSLAIKLLPGGLSGDYAALHSAMVPLSLEGLHTIGFNFLFGLYMAGEAFNGGVLLAAGCTLAILAFLFTSDRSRLVRALITLLILIFSVMGMLMFLQQPAVRPRTLMGFSLLLVFAAYAAYQVLRDWPQLRAAALGLATAWFFVLANVTANAARDQTRFGGFLAAKIIRDLEQVGFKSGGTLAFDGVQPLSPVAAQASRLKIVARVLQPNMNGNSEWGFRLLQLYGFAATPVMDATDESLKAFCIDAPVASTPQYQIFLHDGAALVSFENGVCFRR